MTQPDASRRDQSRRNLRLEGQLRGNWSGAVSEETGRAGIVDVFGCVSPSRFLGRELTTDRSSFAKSASQNETSGVRTFLCSQPFVRARAKDTLQRHASDPRQVVPRARLLAGKSGDRAWDGMQTYLVATGELHNNARMGWGKAIARWAASPEEAVELLVELNNRFALDGHAPPSYAGVLGSLGLFEGSKAEAPVLGRIAYKPPKARYAALPSKIDELAPHSAGGGARPGPTTSGAASGAASWSHPAPAPRGPSRLGP